MTQLARTLAVVAAAVGTPVGFFASEAFARQRVLGTSLTPLVTDGARYGAFVPAVGAITVADFGSGKKQVFAVADGCQPQDGAPDVFLVNCRDQAGFAMPFVLNAKRHQLTRVVGNYDIRSEDFAQIGRYWLAGTDSASGHSIVEHRNWRTGAVVNNGEEGDAVPRDLNSPGLDELGPPTSLWAAVLAARPYVVAITARGLRESVVLRRAGHPTRVLERCSRPCSGLEAGGGLVTWTDGQTASAYRLHSRRHQTWAVGQNTGITHSRGRVFLSVPNRTPGPFGSTRYTIRYASAPR
jgi:hypothetical protein